MLDQNIKTIRLQDQDYPALLKEINNPPSLLYYVGNLPKQDLFPLAIVGSRNCDNYGKNALFKILTPEIIDKTLIVSGLAEGIDTKAHQIAKYTIAVLGTGVDEASCYPKSNQTLRRQIIEQGGMILSEYPPGTKACAQNFPKRNRLIAGLSKAVLVVQAKKRSGALITARLALENGRDVFAVPGSIFNDLSEGCHHLIAQGAFPISNSEDLKQYLTQD